MSRVVTSRELQQKAKTYWKLWIAGGLAAGAGILGASLHHTAGPHIHHEMDKEVR